MRARRRISRRSAVVVPAHGGSEELPECLPKQAPQFDDAGLQPGDQIPLERVLRFQYDDDVPKYALLKKVIRVATLLDLS